MLNSNSRILIVEDEVMVTDIMREFLEKINPEFAVRISTTIQSAKDILDNQSFDIILLDVFLPDGVGIELMKWLRKKRNRC